MCKNVKEKYISVNFIQNCLAYFLKLGYQLLNSSKANQISAFLIYLLCCHKILYLNI